MSYSIEQKEKIFEHIFDEMSKGRSLRSVLKDEGMIPPKTFYEWIDSDSEKSKQYARACEIRADAIFDEIIEISDNSSGDAKINENGQEVLNNEFVARSRLRVDARKWIASKLAPKKYGEKLDIDHTTAGEKIETVTVYQLPDNQRNKGIEED